MIYLLAKYTFLFLLTGVLSFILGYWWSRRNFVDVTDSFEDLRRAKSPNDGLWSKLWHRLDSLDGSVKSTFRQEIGAIPQPDIPSVDLDGIELRLDGIERRFGDIPKPKETDLSNVYERLNSLNDAVNNIPAPKEPEPVNLQPLLSQTARLEDAVKNIPVPERTQAVNLQPLHSQATKIEDAIKNLPTPAQPQSVNLQPLQERVERIEAAVQRIPVERAPNVDIKPMEARIQDLERSIRTLPRPDPVNLHPVNTRLTGIEEALKGLKLQQTRPAPVAPVQKPTRVASGTFVAKDDLKKISGIGPMLEGLLNKNGVFCFWQVASWTPEDIKSIEARLEDFKGRIERDDWISQAERLKEQPDATRPPV